MTTVDLPTLHPQIKLIFLVTGRAGEAKGFLTMEHVLLMFLHGEWPENMLSAGRWAERKVKSNPAIQAQFLHPTLARGTAVEGDYYFKDYYFKESLLHGTMSPGVKKNPNLLAGIINGDKPHSDNQDSGILRNSLDYF